MMMALYVVYNSLSRKSRCGVTFWSTIKRSHKRTTKANIVINIIILFNRVISAAWVEASIGGHTGVSVVKRRGSGYKVFFKLASWTK